MVKLKIILVDHVMENRFIKYRRTRINIWNPLTYLLLIFSLIVLFVMEGIKGFEDIENPFKPIIDQAFYYKKSDVKVIDN